MVVPLNWTSDVLVNLQESFLPFKMNIDSCLNVLYLQRHAFRRV